VTVLEWKTHQKKPVLRMNNHSAELTDPAIHHEHPPRTTYPARVKSAVWVDDLPFICLGHRGAALRAASSLTCSSCSLLAAQDSCEDEQQHRKIGREPPYTASTHRQRGGIDPREIALARPSDPQHLCPALRSILRWRRLACTFLEPKMGPPLLQANRCRR
jgi:hypothetical protein